MVISNCSLEHFNREFQFLSFNEKNEKRELFPPILIDFRDFDDASSKSHTSRIFIEEGSSKDYEKSPTIRKLDIKFVLRISPSNNQEKQALTSKATNGTLENKLAIVEFCEFHNADSVKKSKNIVKKFLAAGSNMLFLYEETKYQETLAFLVDFLSKMLKLSTDSINQYLGSLFPHKKSLGLEPHANNVELIQEKSAELQLKKKDSAKKIPEIQNRCDEMTNLIGEAFKKTKEIEQIIEVLQKLITNIIAEPENEKFRSIKTTNEKLKKTIFSSTSMIKLVELCGFNKTTDNPQIYRNGLDIANIKIIKSDLDLAFKNFLKKKS